MGIEGAQIQCMGTPYNTGAGLKMAVEAGESLRGCMSQWAGCFVAAQPAKNWMRDVEAYEANEYNDELGGKYFVADTLEELADQLNASGVATYKVHKANFLKTVAEYNAAAEEVAGAGLFPPKCASSYSCKPLTEPPFYAFPMQAAVYAPYGGVAIDTNAQVLDLSRKPIAGLYATVPCAGGVFHEFYTGTIAGAAITGRMAGSAAAAQVRG